MSVAEYVELSGNLTVVIHCDVGELHVRRDQLGLVLTTQRHGISIRVELPSVNEGYRLQLLTKVQALIGRRGEDGADDQLFVVKLVQVQVEMGRGLGSEGAGNAEYVALLSIWG